MQQRSVARAVSITEMPKRLGMKNLPYALVMGRKAQHGSGFLTCMLRGLSMRTQCVGIGRDRVDRSESTQHPRPGPFLFIGARPALACWREASGDRTEPTPTLMAVEAIVR